MTKRSGAFFARRRSSVRQVQDCVKVKIRRPVASSRARAKRCTFGLKAGWLGGCAPRNGERDSAQRVATRCGQSGRDLWNCRARARCGHPPLGFWQKL